MQGGITADPVARKSPLTPSVPPRYFPARRIVVIWPAGLQPR
jgi:hypothetical protein